MRARGRNEITSGSSIKTPLAFRDRFLPNRMPTGLRRCF